MLSEQFERARTSDISNDVVIRAENLAKCYHIYPGNKARLRQIFFPRKKYYEEFWALKDINLEIRRGQVFGVVGPNGAGKSTFLQIVAGILQPTDGQIRVNGRVSAMLELGSGFDTQYTGRENAYINGAIMGLSRKDMSGRMGAIRDFAGIGDFFDRPVWMYSSGMVARLAFAVAINMEPDVLVVDEVLSVGDLAFQRKCSEHITELQKKDVTIIYVSHTLPSVENLCSQAMLLEKGHIVMIGTSSEVVRHYQKEYEKTRFVPGEAILQDVSKALGDKKHDRTAIEEYYAQIDNQRQELGDDDKHPFQTGEVEFRRISCLNQNDERCTVFKCSDRLKVRVEYFSKLKISKPVFMVTIYNSKGIHCCGSRTVKAGVSAEDVCVEEIEGEGVFEADFGQIRLNSDTYTLAVAVFDSLIHIPYALSRILTIEVKADSWNSNVGIQTPIMMPSVNWRFS